MKNVLVSLFCLSTIVLSGQNIDSLEFFGDVMRNAEIGSHRSHAAKVFKKQFLSALQNNRDLSDSPILKWVSCVSDSAHSITFYTWQINHDDAIQYEGVFVPKGEKPILLNSAEMDWASSEYDQFTDQEWPGALYYKLLERNGSYVLLGLNASDKSNNVKVAESFGKENGEWTFGLPVFFMDNDPVRPNVKNRIVVHYDKRSAARMNYDEQNDLLFFDHVIPMETMEAKDQVSWVPDGSYEGFEWKEGKWMYAEKLFEQSVETPPTDGRIRDKGRDVMGRPVTR